jgi:hypothetical protein
MFFKAALDHIAQHFGSGTLFFLGIRPNLSEEGGRDIQSLDIGTGFNSSTLAIPVRRSIFQSSTVLFGGVTHHLCLALHFWGARSAQGVDNHGPTANHGAVPP